MKCVRSIVACAGLIILSACGSLMQGTPVRMPAPGALPSDQAMSVLFNLQQKNIDLKTFKGIGKVRLINRRGSESARMAWAASVEEKIRMDVLSVTGQPMFTVSSDGKWFYMLSYAQHRFLKKETTRSSLKQLIDIPVETPDIIALIGGRIPVCEHQTAFLFYDTDRTGYVLELVRRRGQIVEKIYLDDSRRSVEKIERFDSSGDLVYRAEFRNISQMDGFLVPVWLMLHGKDGSSLELKVEKYWTNIFISPSVFVLTPPENRG
ncbi:MAG: hypothetical protein PHP23_01255 [Desulfobacterales bacterium]|nr:hypothetical protein [Desulfobacterales bacterium]MDD4071169.1 hypothetical protein [Desulfobacterales bacterium]MDD4393365.1 hypothetical protein [Desulfobacterales bacterium]